MTNPPQLRTLIFSFIRAKLKIDCQNGVKKCGVFLKVKTLSIFGGHVTNPATPHTDFQFYCSEAKIRLPKWCKKMGGYKKKKSQCEWQNLLESEMDFQKMDIFFVQKMSKIAKTIPNSLKNTVVTDMI